MSMASRNNPGDPAIIDEDAGATPSLIGTTIVEALNLKSLASPIASLSTATHGIDDKDAAGFVQDQDKAVSNNKDASRDGSLSLDELRAALGEISEMDAILGEKQRYLADLVKQRHSIERTNRSGINPASRGSASSSAMSESGLAANAKGPAAAESASRLASLVPDNRDGDEENEIVKSAEEWEASLGSAAFLTQLPGSALDHQDRTGGEMGSTTGSSTSTAHPRRVKVSRSKLRAVTPPAMSTVGSTQSLVNMFRTQRDFSSDDFVARNKAMGAEARYYSALTPREQDRVELILADEETNESSDSEDEGDDTHSKLEYGEDRVSLSTV
ncbi:hypothetical protein BC828DRAFT_392591 [Blastocladiella britannica]|nr:hypothetical protein BC828DRAFT_392591 [Blastocladiella britannica]